ncbi:MAG: 3-hydroxybutyrate dehydrogenase [Acidimicrobiales bacterium]|nr:3-hydroxybutyrate dehydrogenase [Acidimicrobiales bacterium]
MGLSGKTALVTGSTSGIGLGMATALAREGANVVLNGLGDTDAISAAIGQIAAHGVDTFHHPADLRDPAQIEQMVAAAEDRYGRVDILVNNAGIQHVSPVEHFPTERWDAVLAVNLSSAFHTIRCALPAMKAAGWGRIINLASAHGLVASVDKAAYVAAKHGMIGLTKVVALETARSAVTCNAICPGWVLTPLVKAQIEQRAADAGVSFEEATSTLLGEKQPSHDFVTPEQLGEVAVFLCTDAAAQVRGAAWTVDGGWCAQ